MPVKLDAFRSGACPAWFETEKWAALQEGISTYRLKEEWLVDQLKNAPLFVGPLTVADAAALRLTVQQIAGGHSQLLVRMAEADGSWQRPAVEALTEAYFLLERFVRLKKDVQAERIWIPQIDLDQYQVGLEQLKNGPIDEKMRRLLWKQGVRIREAFARALPLAAELPKRFKRPFKRTWIGGLRLIDEIERREYDVWTESVTLSSLQTRQVILQSWLRSATFR